MTAIPSEAWALNSRNGFPLVGRIEQIARLENELGLARSGQGRALVLSGEAGIGKSALLDRVVQRAVDFEVVRCRGIESEQMMPFAGLHLLYVTRRAHLDQLNEQQRGALDAVFGVSVGSRDPYQAGQAVLPLLTVGAGQRPMLLVIDDAQWLDDESAATMAFVLRRLECQPMLALVATREPVGDSFIDLSVEHLGRLNETEARRLLTVSSIGPNDEILAGQIVAESRGNPGSILELLTRTTSPEFAGSYNPAICDCCYSVHDALAARMRALDADERRFLMLAAAEPTGDPVLLWRAAATLGLKPSVARRLVDKGWLEFGSRVLLRSPAERSATYRSATAEERTSLHLVLAQATDPVSAPDRRAWHLASATTGLDESLAESLAGYADLAEHRSGRAGAAAFLERAAMLTGDPRLRSERALAASIARFDAGSVEGSVQMLVTAEFGRLDQPVRGGVERQRARVAFFRARNGEAAEQLLHAAPHLRTSDGRVSYEGYLEALVAATFAAQLGPGAETVARKMPADIVLDSLTNRLLVGLTARLGQRPQRGRQSVMLTLRAAAQSDRELDGRRWVWLAALMAADLWDDSLWDGLTSKALDAAFEAGSLMLAPYVLTGECLFQLHLGHIDRAREIVEELDATTSSTRAPRFHTAAMLLAGWRGEEQTAEALIEGARRDALARGEGIILTVASLASAILFNGLGRYGEALCAALDAAQDDALAVSGWALVELIEASARAGQPDTAKSALARLTQRTQAAGTDWALGIEARSRALLVDGAEAEPYYKEAVKRLARSRACTHLARAQLVYGEWLRRQGRQVDARDQLKAAAHSLEDMGASAFADRAHREYLATSDKLRRNASNDATLLTPQETLVADLAQSGLTNPEIAQRLYLSPRTVEYHLNKVFRKRGISSRRELLYWVREARPA